MNLVFLGAPGAGKGTQAATLAQEQGWSHIASGDLFRQAVERGDELGRRVQSFLDQGLLVPDETAIELIIARLEALAPGQGFILDGFPRTLNQARALDQALAATGKALDKAVYLHIKEEELIRRLTARLTCRNCQTPYNLVASPPKKPGRCDRCGGELYQRPDDNETAVRQRWQVFLTQTAPLLDYYTRQSKLSLVNGELGMVEVTQGIKRALEIKDEHHHQVSSRVKAHAPGRKD